MQSCSRSYKQTDLISQQIFLAAQLRWRKNPACCELPTKQPGYLTVNEGPSQPCFNLHEGDLHTGASSRGSPDKYSSRLPFLSTPLWGARIAEILRKSAGAGSSCSDWAHLYPVQTNTPLDRGSSRLPLLAAALPARAEAPPCWGQRRPPEAAILWAGPGPEPEPVRRDGAGAAGALRGRRGVVLVLEGAGGGGGDGGADSGRGGAASVAGGADVVHPGAGRARRRPAEPPGRVRCLHRRGAGGRRGRPRAVVRAGVGGVSGPASPGCSKPSPRLAFRLQPGRSEPQRGRGDRVPDEDPGARLGGGVRRRQGRQTRCRVSARLSAPPAGRARSQPALLSPTAGWTRASRGSWSYTRPWAVPWIAAVPCTSSIACRCSRRGSPVSGAALGPGDALPKSHAVLLNPELGMSQIAQRGGGCPILWDV